MLATKVNNSNKCIEYREILKAPNKITKSEIDDTLGKIHKYRLSFTIFYNINSKKWVFVESNKIPYKLSRVSTISDKLNIDLRMFETRKQAIDCIHSEIIDKIYNIKRVCIYELKGMGIQLTKPEIQIIFTILKKRD